MLVYGECECFVMQMLYVCVFILSCIHLQSFVKKASSPFSHTSAKLLHCWCHKYKVISIQKLGRQTTSRLTEDNIHDSRKQQWTQYRPLMQTNLHFKTFTHPSICSNYSASFCIQYHNCADEPLMTHPHPASSKPISPPLLGLYIKYLL